MGTRIRQRLMGPWQWIPRRNGSCNGMAFGPQPGRGLAPEHLTPSPRHNVIGGDEEDFLHWLTSPVPRDLRGGGGKLTLSVAAEFIHFLLTCFDWLAANFSASSN
jgi:hypothetical protein